MPNRQEAVRENTAVELYRSILNISENIDALHDTGAIRRVIASIRTLENSVTREFLLHIASLVHYQIDKAAYSAGDVRKIVVDLNNLVDAGKSVHAEMNLTEIYTDVGYTLVPEPFKSEGLWVRAVIDYAHDMDRLFNHEESPVESAYRRLLEAFQKYDVDSAKLDQAAILDIEAIQAKIEDDLKDEASNFATRYVRRAAIVFVNFHKLKASQDSAEIRSDLEKNLEAILGTLSKPEKVDAIYQAIGNCTSNTRDEWLRGARGFFQWMKDEVQDLEQSSESDSEEQSVEAPLPRQENAEPGLHASQFLAAAAYREAQNAAQAIEPEGVADDMDDVAEVVDEPADGIGNLLHEEAIPQQPVPAAPQAAQPVAQDDEDSLDEVLSSFSDTVEELKKDAESLEREKAAIREAFKKNRELRDTILGRIRDRNEQLDRCRQAGYSYRLEFLEAGEVGGVPSFDEALDSMDDLKEAHKTAEQIAAKFRTLYSKLDHEWDRISEAINGDTRHYRRLSVQQLRSFLAIKRTLANLPAGDVEHTRVLPPVLALLDDDEDAVMTFSDSFNRLLTMKMNVERLDSAAKQMADALRHDLLRLQQQVGEKAQKYAIQRDLAERTRAKVPALFERRLPALPPRLDMVASDSAEELAFCRLAELVEKYKLQSDFVKAIDAQRSALKEALRQTSDALPQSAALAGSKRSADEAQGGQKRQAR